MKRLLSRPKKVASIFVCVLNDHEHQFDSKKEMDDYVAWFRSEHNEIKSLNLFRFDCYNLIP